MNSLFIPRYLSPMNRPILLCTYAYCCLTLLTGCKVYYTTSDVDSNLKSTVDQVNTTLTTLKAQVAELEKGYRDLPCEQKSDAFKQADGMMRDLESEMRSLEQMKQTVNNDYQQFRAYTHGKNRIESGTEEWSQLKQTKAKMKENFDALRQQGNAVVAEATAFNTYVNTNIASKLEVCEVKTYTNQFETALATLNTNLQSAKKEAVQYEAEVSRASAQYGNTAAPTFNQLQEHVRNIQSKLREMDPVQRNAQRILTEFKTKTSGIERIYSCNSNWPLVSETDKAIREQEQLFQVIKASISQESSAIEQLIAGLGKDGK
jgi:uncharacterized coiled-coil DUF342 family protein